MKPSQMHTDLSDQPSVPSGFTDFNDLREFTGRYYRALGWIDLASAIVALAICYWTGHLAITFSFIFWFWLGSRLKEGNPAARKWAIATPLLHGTILSLGILFPGIGLRLNPWGIGLNHPLFFPLAGIQLVAHVIPGIMVLGERGRRAFSQQKTGEQGGDGDSEPAV